MFRISVSWYEEHLWKISLQTNKYAKSYRLGVYIRHSAPGVFDWMTHTLAYGGGPVCHGPAQTLKIKKFINSMRIFRCNLRIFGVICVFFGVILQNYSGGMPRDPLRVVVLKLICDVTRLWRNLIPPREFSAYATGRMHASFRTLCIWTYDACMRQSAPKVLTKNFSLQSSPDPPIFKKRTVPSSPQPVKIGKVPELPMWLFWSQIFKFWLFLNTFGFFWKSKKARQNLFFFSRKGLDLEKHSLSCIFITNLLSKESITMQDAQNIERILLLAWNRSILLLRNKCTTV